MKNGNHASFRMAVATSAILVFSLFFLASLRDTFANPFSNIAAHWKFDDQSNITDNDKTKEEVSTSDNPLCYSENIEASPPSNDTIACGGDSPAPTRHGPIWSSDTSPSTDTTGSLLFKGEDSGPTSGACNDDGECGFVLTDLNRPDSPISYTVAFWVKTTHVQPETDSWFPMPVLSYHGKDAMGSDNGFSVGVGFYDVNPKDENAGKSGLAGGVTFMYEKDHDQLCGVATTDNNKLVNDGEWHHVAATWKKSGSKIGREFQIYIDGTQVTTNTFDRNAVAGNYCDKSPGETTDKPATIGYNAMWSYDTLRGGADSTTKSPNYEQFFDGQLDDVRVYTRALTLDEIWQLSGGNRTLNIKGYPEGAAPLIGNVDSTIQFQEDYQGGAGETAEAWHWDYNGNDGNTVGATDQQIVTYRWDTLGEKTVDLSATIDLGGGTKTYSETEHKIQISKVTISDDGINSAGNPNTPVTFTAKVDNGLDISNLDGMDFEWVVSGAPSPTSPQNHTGINTKEDQQVFTWSANGTYNVAVTVTAKKDGSGRGVLTDTHTIDIGESYPNDVIALNEGQTPIDGELVAFDEVNGYYAVVTPTTVNWPVDYTWDCTFCTDPTIVEVAPAASAQQSHPYKDTRVQGTDTLTSARIDFTWKDTRPDPTTSPSITHYITPTGGNALGTVSTSVRLTVSHRPTISPGGTTLADVGPFTATILEDSQRQVTYQFDVADKDTALANFDDPGKMSVTATPNVASLYPAQITPTLVIMGDMSGKQRQLSYSLQDDQWGVVSTTVRACDEVGLCGSDISYLNIIPINDAPAFTVTETTLTVEQDAPEQNIPAWAQEISRGPYEDHQDIMFHITPLTNSGNVDIDNMFSVAPAITTTTGTTGTLRFQPAPGAFGSVIYDISLQDDGGKDNGGEDTSQTRRFTITIDSNTPLTPVSTLEDTPVTIRYARMVNYTTQSSDPILQSTTSQEKGSLQATNAPTNSSEMGYVVYTPTAHFFGTGDSADLFSYEYHDGIMTRTTEMSISVEPVNDPPTYTLASAVLTSPSSPIERNVENWVTDLAPGPTSVAPPYNESAQTLNPPQVTVSDPSLFTVEPALTVAAGGNSANLTFTPVDGVTGDVTVDIVFQDDGGTEYGGTDTTSSSFVLRFKKNDPPVLATTVLSTPMNTPLQIAARHDPEAEIVGLMTDADEIDVLTFVAISDEPDHGTLNWNVGDEVIEYVPSNSFAGTDLFKYTISDGYERMDGEVTINIIGSNNVYLPIIASRIRKADLALSENSIQIAPDRTAAGNAYAAGEPVVVNVTVTNAGNAPTEPFWIDMFINPSQQPTVNTSWFDVCSLDPCFGLAWGLEQPLAIGQSIVFTSAYTGSETQPAGYREDFSNWEGWFANGTTDLYVLVDSWNEEDGQEGGIPELDEGNNLGYLAVTVTGTNPTETNINIALSNEPREQQSPFSSVVSRIPNLPLRPTAPGGQ